MLKTPSQSNLPAGPQASLFIRPRRVFMVLLVVLLAIVSAGGIANALIYQVLPDSESAAGRALRRIDIGHEPSLLQWYSSLQLAACALLLFAVAHCKRSRQAGDVGYWMLLGLGFFLLSVDEAVMIHEMGDRVVEPFMNTGGAFYFAWVILGLAVVLGSALVFLRFLIRLDGKTRNYYLLAGAVFVGGAIGVEMISGVVAEHWLKELPSGNFAGTHPWGMPAFTLCQVVEEGMELLGISIFLTATLEHLGRLEGGLKILPAGSSSSAAIQSTME